jgi:tetratricopeptide (TPR) repeat protein
LTNFLSTYPSHGKYQATLTAFVDKLMVRGERNDAEIWFRALQESVKQSPGDAQRLALGTSRITTLVKRHPVLTKSLAAGNAAVLRALADKTGEKINKLALAEYLGSVGRLEEALQLCEQLLKEAPPQQVIPIAVSAACAKRANAEQFARIDAWLATARKQVAAENQLWDLQSAILKERQTLYAEAENLYRNVLKTNPSHLVVRNNLACLLCLRGKGSEAMEMLQFAITEFEKKIGPADELLDSRAAILHAQGKLVEAEKDILASLKMAETPYRLFHLAQIQHSKGQTKEAKQTFTRANDLGLSINMLHPLEEKSYDALLNLR